MSAQKKVVVWIMKSGHLLHNLN